MRLNLPIFVLLLSALTACFNRSANANNFHELTMKTAETPLLEIQSFIKDNPGKIQLFWSRVNKDGPRMKPHLSKCWNWEGPMIGMYGAGGSLQTTRATIRSHRLSFVLHGGVLTDEKPHVLHSCDNTLCVNPEHLRAGDQRDNNTDKHQAGRQPRGEAMHTCILTSAQVTEIRTRHAAGGLRYKDLAQEYGVANCTIGEIIRRVIWTHI